MLRNRIFDASFSDFRHDSFESQRTGHINKYANREEKTFESEDAITSRYLFKMTKDEDKNKKNVDFSTFFWSE